MAEQPIPVFTPQGIKPALTFKAKLSGAPKKLRKAPRAPPSRAPEILYIRQLNIVFRELVRLVQEIVLPDIRSIAEDAPREIRERLDAVGADEIRAKILEIINRTGEADITTITTSAATELFVDPLADRARQRKQERKGVARVRQQINSMFRRGSIATTEQILPGQRATEVRRFIIPRAITGLEPAVITFEPTKLSDTIEDLRIAFQGEAPFETIASRAAIDAAVRGGRDIKKVVGTVLGVRPELAEPWLDQMIDQFSEENAKLVGKVSDDFIDRLEATVAARMREGLRAEEIAKEIQRDFINTQGAEFKKAKARAKLIARDQTASLQGDITRVRQTQLGVKRYRWRTAKDERVRKSHKEREGEIFIWGEPIGPQLRKKGLTVDKIDGPPGRPILCRCYPEPVLEDIVPGLPEI